MQIRLSGTLDPREGASTAPMTVDDFLARFPEVPRDLRDEPVLEDYVRSLGPLLRLAKKPAPCAARAGGEAPHLFYMRLVNDLAIYGVGLGRRDRTLERLRQTLVEYRRQPATFGCSLVPRRLPGSPPTGCA